MDMTAQQIMMGSSASTVHFSFGHRFRDRWFQQARCESWSVFTATATLLVHGRCGFFLSVLIQSGLGIRSVQSTHKPTVRGGYQDALHVAGVEPLEDRFNEGREEEAAQPMDEESCCCCKD